VDIRRRGTASLVELPMKVPVKLLAFAAVAVILCAMCSGCVMVNEDRTLAPLAVLAVSAIAAAGFLAATVRRWVLVLFFLALALGIAGCGTTEHLDLGDPQEATKAASCAPLPLCDIPPGANSTQLETALWACVKEYRALYSVCYHMKADSLEVDPAHYQRSPQRAPNWPAGDKTP
jgi:hypothetical protein